METVGEAVPPSPSSSSSPTKRSDFCVPTSGPDAMAPEMTVDDKARLATEPSRGTPNQRGSRGREWASILASNNRNGNSSGSGPTMGMLAFPT